MRFAELKAALPAHKATLAATGFLSLRDVEALTDDQLTELAEGFSDRPERRLLEWDFGHLMRMRLDPQAPNYLFSAEAVPLHWDGAFHEEPRYLLFYCDESQGEGGETVFVDTRDVLAGAAPETVAAWEGVTLTYTTEKLAHYGGTFSTKVVREHPFTGERILRFAEAVATEKNPVTVEVEGSDDPDFYAGLAARVTAPEHTREHRWRAGDLVLVDNHAFLHGRRALGENTGRAFRRIQVL